jgi:hypothetical protein
MSEEVQSFKFQYNKERLQAMLKPLYVDDDNCIRCGKFINSQTYFGVLCEKCNKLWFKYCGENGLDPLSPISSSKTYWIEFVRFNPSRRN